MGLVSASEMLSDMQSECLCQRPLTWSYTLARIYFIKETRCFTAMSMQRLSNTYTQQPSRRLQQGQYFTSTHRVHSSKRRRLEHKHRVLLVLAAAEHRDKVEAQVFWISANSDKSVEHVVSTIEPCLLEGAAPAAMSILLRPSNEYSAS